MSRLGAQLKSHPKGVSFVIMAIFFVLTAVLLFAFAGIFNVIQQTRLEHARADRQAQGQAIDEADLQKRFPTIEIF